LKAVDVNAQPDFVSLEGYLVGRLVIAALGKIDGEPTQKALLAAIDGGKFDFSGIELDYGPNDNRGSERVFLTVIQQDGSFKPVVNLS